MWLGDVSFSLYLMHRFVQANLVIELTESTVVDNLDAVALALAELRDIGVCAAIDEHTLVVPISHVVFSSAYIQDVKKIAARAKAVSDMLVTHAEVAPRRISSKGWG